MKWGKRPQLFEVSDKPCEPEQLEDMEIAYELEMLDTITSRCYFQIESIEVSKISA